MAECLGGMVTGRREEPVQRPWGGRILVRREYSPQEKSSRRRSQIIYWIRAVVKSLDYAERAGKPWEDGGIFSRGVTQSNLCLTWP